uniref:Uncharacterized protein n=1 Tax=Kalanchoe fedtschenkoi TaxID=63787 RepID=A0A7N0TKR5_KALFE
MNKGTGGCFRARGSRGLEKKLNGIIKSYWRKVAIDGERKDALNGQICYARLPRGIDPHSSVPSDELAASLGEVLLNLVVHNLAAPTLHNSGFAGIML